VGTLVKVPLTQNQFDALVDFVFNLGEKALKSSTLLRLLNSGLFLLASQEFMKWNHDNGKVIDGLTKRRRAEMFLFNS
jgi:lysozyme